MLDVYTGKVAPEYPEADDNRVQAAGGVNHPNAPLVGLQPFSVIVKLISTASPLAPPVVFTVNV
jgi:hypothetical protein